MQVSRRYALLLATPALPTLTGLAQAQAASAAPLTLVTSELPPMAMPGEPGQRGVLLDLVEALLRQAELLGGAEFFPWARATLLASVNPRTLIMPLNRTAEREPKFQWLVKLYTQRFTFMTLANKPRIDRSEQLHRLRIASLRGSSNLDGLRRLGMKPSQVYPSTSVSDMQRALERGLVDGLYGSELIHVDAWRRSGRDPALLQTGLTLESADIWLAAHSGITEAEQARLRQAHEALVVDGSVERLFKRYGLTYRP